MKPKFLLRLTCLPALCFCYATAAPGSPDVAALVAQAAKYQSGESLTSFRQLEILVGQTVANPQLRAEVEKGLIELAGSGSTFEARRFACKQLGIIGTAAALPTLSGMLAEEQTAGIACLALTTYPRGKADQVLREALKKATGNARVQIINTLGDRRDPGAIKQLAACAAGSDRVAAEAALTSLGKIGTLTAWKNIKALRKTSVVTGSPVLNDAMLRCADRLEATDPAAATEIYESLQAASQPAHLRRGALAGLCRLDKDQGEARILRALQSEDAALRPIAIAQVAQLRSPDASQRFAAELPRLSPQEQTWMIASLAARGDAPAREAIATSLGSADGEVRRAAVAALTRAGDASVVPLLCQIFPHADAQESRALESALVDNGGGSATDKAIATALVQAPASSRVHLIAVLARRQGAAANPILFQQAGDSDPAVAQAALRALGRTATEAEIPALLTRIHDAKDPEVRTAAANAAGEALSRVKDPAVRSALVTKSLNTAPDAETRAALLGLLPACGDTPALAHLKTATDDPDPTTREAAVRALAEWPDLSAWDALETLYGQPKSEVLRGVALRGLVRLAGEANAHPDSHLAERYMQLLAGARSDADLKLILGALSGAAHPETLQLVLPLLSNEGVRAEAEVAVRKIAEAIKKEYPEAAKQALERVQRRP